MKYLIPFVFATALGAVSLVAATPKKLLVVEVTTGYRHASIATGERILSELATTSGQFTVEFVRQPDGQPKEPAKPKAGADGEKTPAYLEAQAKYEENTKAYQTARTEWLVKVAEVLKPLDPRNLAKYDGVIFLSTTGDLPLPDKQGFLDWIAAGHAFVGIHAATDTFHNDMAFIGMIGAEFKTHGAQVSVDCLNQDPAHAATKMLPASWTVYDEIYQFKNFERSKVHGLLTMDKHPNDKTPGDYPVAWAKRHGTGRVFYTSLGHREDVWDPAAAEGGKRRNDPELSRLYQQHLLGGILWSLGLAPGEVNP